MPRIPWVKVRTASVRVSGLEIFLYARHGGVSLTDELGRHLYDAGPPGGRGETETAKKLLARYTERYPPQQSLPLDGPGGEPKKMEQGNEP